MNGHLMWGQEDHADISSVEELDRALDQLTIESERIGMPTGVQLQIDGGAAMSIVVGREESHVEFYSPTARPPAVGCRGPWQGEEGDELLVFNFGGEYTEIEKRYSVPVAQAREAIRIFFTTGLRPENIAWGQ